MNFKRPMLAASLLSSTIEHTNLNILQAMERCRFPVLATTKRDGVRGLRLNQTDLSRALKEIPNKSICERAKKLPPGFDFEHWKFGLGYNEIQSIVMSEEHCKSDEIEFHILDVYHPTAPYSDRLALVEAGIWKDWTDVKFEYPILCESAESLLEFFLDREEKGEEGICFRLLNSKYKFGRSTLREQGLIKLSRYSYSEAVITGFIEQMENSNCQTTSTLGLSERSSHRENMIGKNTLGALQCQLASSEVISIGTGVGLTDKLRREIWHNQSKYLGRTIKFKHKPHGQKNLPRSPIFVGLRNEIDI